MSWVYDRQTTVYSRVKAMLTAKLKSKYPNLNVTQDNATPTNSQFPTIYIAFIGANERGETLDGTTINAVNMTVEVHIKTTKTQGVVSNNEIAWDVVDIFKTMGFTATMPNIPTSDVNGVYESVSRYSRIIGQGDVI